MSVSGTGGGGGVVRSRRQVWTIDTANNGGKVDVILGVNGYIWISKHIEGQGDGETSITRIEESVSSTVYSSQNDSIGAETRREIARICGVVRALVEGGCRVDENLVTKGYQVAVEEMMGGDGDYLGGQRGKDMLQIVLGI